MGTYKADKHLITGVDGNLSAVVIDYHRGGRLAVRTKGSIETNTLHAVVQQLVISLSSVLLGPTADHWKMDLSFLREVVVDDLSELPLLEMFLPQRQRDYLPLATDWGS